jgi:hypothetical protein
VVYFSRRSGRLESLALRRSQGRNPSHRRLATDNRQADA